MPAPSKSFTAIPDTSIDPDSPLDTALMTALRDNDIHLEEWLGLDYTAAQNHNHDGVNSALIQVGSNYLRNGSFEDGTSGWTFSNFTGGSNAISTSNQYDGLRSLELTSTVLANGGCEAINNEFMAVSGGEVRALNFAVQASAAGVSSKVEAVWYDKDQALISSSTLLSYASTPTAWTRERLGCVAPAAARFMRLRFTGGVPAVGSGAGTIRFDGISLTAAGSGLLKVQSGNVAAVASLDLVWTDLTQFQNKKVVLNNWIPVTDVVQLLGRVSSNGGSSFDSGTNNYGHAFEGRNTAAIDFTGQGASTSMVFNIASVGNLSTEGIHAEITVFGTGKTGSYTQCDFRTVQVDNTGSFAFSQGTTGRAAAQDTDAFQLRFSSGNIAFADYAVYVLN